MQLYCDRCNEAADHPIPIASGDELAEIAGDLGYRAVCPGCYDDLLVEANETREHRAEDRRAERRVATALAIRLTPAGGGEAHETVADDVSESGARVRAVAAVAPGDVVRLETGDGAAEAVAIVEVVWHDGDALRAGLRLVEASESWRRLVAEREADDADA
jgi:hypothetical protein